ncbi:hypothetical protein QTI66_25115 [Variovorax sp. J22R133]|uniref:hypothetical protein n=1 Tax=Variovorax brevis TaxID=3053503 RepID=UPI0025776489|nr:hypothetical protein [Variovorax sp. J22R133]MDM0115453.1 hypothetical protein [Variovorax sp. J22R133]
MQSHCNTPPRRSPWQPLAVLAVSGAALLGAIAAQADDSPTVYVNDAGVEYVSGGIGAGEAALMKHASNQWPASFEFAIRDGKRAAFASDVQVTVRDASGQPVLRDVVTQGPFLLAQLLPGRYDVQATFAGRTLTQRIDVRTGAPAHSVFVWPAGTGVSASS